MNESEQKRERPAKWVYWVGGLVAAMWVADLFRPKTASEKAYERGVDQREKVREAERERGIARKAAAENLGYYHWAKGTEGRDLLDASTVTRLDVDDPYPDAVVQRSENEGSISSAQAGATLKVDWTVQDGGGYFLMSEDGKPSVSFQFVAHRNGEIRLSFVSSDLALAHKLARLLASHTRGVIFVRSAEWKAEQVRIWEDYLRRNPEVAAKIGWTGSGPYPYLGRLPD